MSSSELILEKYVKSPVKLTLSGSGLLECNGGAVANNVSEFDAVTDTSGRVHIVLLNSDGQIIYISTNNKLTQNKVIDSGITASALKHFSITEEDGILHILIVKQEKSQTVYRYHTRGSLWIKCAPHTLDRDACFIDGCAVSSGNYAVLVFSDTQYRLFIYGNGGKISSTAVSVPKGLAHLSITYNKPYVELTAYNRRGEIESIRLAEPAPLACICTDTRKDNAMSNGNMINSKYISQLQSNTLQIEAFSAELEEIRKELEAIKSVIERTEKQQSTISMIKDALNTHEAKLNQLSISVKETSNRLNAMKSIKAPKD